MADQLTINKEGSTLYLAGELDSDTVLPLWQQRNSVVSGMRVFNLSGLTRVDTAGIALLIHLLALAKQQTKEAHLEGVSEKIASLIQLYNLPETLLPCH